MTEKITKLFLQMIANTASKTSYCTGLLKIKTITTRDSGLTREGLDNLSQVRVTQAHSSSLNMRNEHASLALEMFSEYGAMGPCQQFFDNAMMRKKHYVQGYSLFELNSGPELHELSTSDMCLEDRLELFSLDTLDLDHHCNTELKTSVDALAVRVVAIIIGSEVPGYEYLGSQFPFVYDHPHSDTAADVSHFIKNPTIPLNEAANDDMCDILEVNKNFDKLVILKKNLSTLLKPDEIGCNFGSSRIA